MLNSYLRIFVLPVAAVSGPVIRRLSASLSSPGTGGRAAAGGAGRSGALICPGPSSSPAALSLPLFDQAADKEDHAEEEGDGEHQGQDQQDIEIDGAVRAGVDDAKEQGPDPVDLFRDGVASAFGGGA